MENMVNKMQTLQDFYRGKRVLVTGHTGFKGSWLSLWLHRMGARVIGLSLDARTQRDNYVLSDIGSRMEADLRGDVRDGKRVKQVFHEYRPDIVFHLAAQPLVRLSYKMPAETFAVNVGGTVNIMEAMRGQAETRVGVMITTDKCYENREWLWPYRENDALGGYDPYSASKGAAEIAIAAWRRSFFNPDHCDIHHKALASVRAGNVIGGGDWAEDRIVPDCIRALESGKEINIRSPHAVRPWQHVLEPLGGYLLLGQKMWDAPRDFAEAWNFGPNQESITDVWTVATKLTEAYGTGSLKDASDPDAPHEAKLLTLDISKARRRLGWQPRLTIDESIRLTVDWYRRYRTENVYDLCMEQISYYEDR